MIGGAWHSHEKKIVNRDQCNPFHFVFTLEFEMNKSVLSPTKTNVQSWPCWRSLNVKILSFVHYSPHRDSMDCGESVRTTKAGEVNWSEHWFVMFVLDVINCTSRLFYGFVHSSNENVVAAVCICFASIPFQSFGFFFNSAWDSTVYQPVFVCHRRWMSQFVGTIEIRQLICIQSEYIDGREWEWQNRNGTNDPVCYARSSSASVQQKISF